MANYIFWDKDKKYSNARDPDRRRVSIVHFLALVDVLRWVTSHRLRACQQLSLKWVVVLTTNFEILTEYVCRWDNFMDILCPTQI